MTHTLYFTTALKGIFTFDHSKIGSMYLILWVFVSLSIQTFCATDWEMFQIDNRVFLVVANGHRLHVSGPSQYAINSTIYELDMIGQLFVRFQDIVTYR